ncbi:hypothetical protein [Magnetococcus sp. PR-3]|uniref:hypothetical protein n=1 Tax=Magnetococcus sp. PR-3 TaxID=3120355 RepID=UPI002FCE1442
MSLLALRNAWITQLATIDGLAKVDDQVACKAISGLLTPELIQSMLVQTPGIFVRAVQVTGTRHEYSAEMMAFVVGRWTQQDLAGSATLAIAQAAHRMVAGVVPDPAIQTPDALTLSEVPDKDLLPQGTMLWLLHWRQRLEIVDPDAQELGLISSITTHIDGPTHASAEDHQAWSQGEPGSESADVVDKTSFNEA